MQLVVTVYVPSSFGVQVVEPRPGHETGAPESIKQPQNEHPLGKAWHEAVEDPLFVMMSQNWLGDSHVGPPSPHVNEAGVEVPQPKRKSRSASLGIAREDTKIQMRAKAASTSSRSSFASLPAAVTSRIASA